MTHTAYGIWFNGGSSYTIAEVTGDEAIQAGSGTRLELSLREDAEDYLEDLKV